jgi:hypothetical protein
MPVIVCYLGRVSGALFENTGNPGRLFQDNLGFTGLLAPLHPGFA